MRNVHNRDDFYHTPGGVMWNKEYGLRKFDQQVFHYDKTDLWHYTTIAGLFGIIEQKGLWLSDHRFMSDISEYTNGRDFTIYILKKLKNKYNYSKFSGVLDNTIKTLEDHKGPIFYIGSFSSEGDSLDQWRTYSKNGLGVSIRFHNTAFGCHIQLMRLSKVTYCRKEKLNKILIMVREYKNKYINKPKKNHVFTDESWAESLAFELASLFIHFKDAAYSSENEVRLIATIGDQFRNEKGPKHRISNNLIVPYYLSTSLNSNLLKGRMKITEVDEDSAPKLEISEVMIGPSRYQNEMELSLIEFLKNKGYEGKIVNKSKIPYRGF